MKCIVCDLDGTLFNTASVGVIAIREAIAHARYKLDSDIEMPTAEHIRSCFGLASNVFYHNLISPWSQLAVDFVHQESLRRQRALLAAGCGELFPRIGDMVRYINNCSCRIYIVSNGSRQYLELIMDTVLSGYRIDEWFSCDGNAVTKSSVLCAIEQRAQEDIIAMVGDRHDDALAANTAGVPFIWCRYGYEDKTVSVDNCYMTAHSPAELFTFIRGILD